jgi:mono/diheme cytochrome c family protein
VRALLGPLVAIAILPAPAALAQDAAKARAGEQVYNTYCAVCHGDRMVTSGQTFDLRKLRAEERPRFENSVLNGKTQMPPWKGALSNEEIDQIWNYIRTNANDSKETQ